MTLEELQHSITEGERVDFLFFWGHKVLKDEITSSCLSQWYPALFTVDGKTFSTAEHYMMAEKARLFHDEEMYEKIIDAPHPAEAKKLGREVKNFDEAIWNDQRFQIVVSGNREKFGQNEELRAFLKGTGEKVLVEASPVDRIWGIGLARDDERAADPFRWNGLNLLGFALMEVRNGL